MIQAVIGRPHDAPADHAVGRLGSVDTDEATARRAGQLRFAVKKSGARRIPGGIDAIVAAHATTAETSVVFTTDPSDLRRLLADFPRITIDRP